MAHTATITSKKPHRRDFPSLRGKLKTSKKYNRTAARRTFIKDILSVKNSVKV